MSLREDTADLLSKAKTFLGFASPETSGRGSLSPEIPPETPAQPIDEVAAPAPVESPLTSTEGAPVIAPVVDEIEVRRQHWTQKSDGTVFNETRQTFWVRDGYDISSRPRRAEDGDAAYVFEDTKPPQMPSAPVDEAEETMEQMLNRLIHEGANPDRQPLIRQSGSSYTPGYHSLSGGSMFVTRGRNDAYNAWKAERDNKE